MFLPGRNAIGPLPGLLVLCSLVTAIACGQASAAPQVFTAQAQVLRVDPIITRERITEPVEQCRLVSTRHPSAYSPHYQERIEPPHRVLRSVVGGLIGGAIGRKVGGGRGRDAMTVIGALAGSSIATSGRRVERELPHGYTRVRAGSVERCEQVLRVRDIETIESYRVRYQYQGEIGTRIVAEAPGETVPVTVTLRPVPPANR